jgi:hypothetical protein
MAIKVRDNYISWVGQRVVPLFEEVGIKITPNARDFLAYTMQSQIDEKVIENDDKLYLRCEEFCNFAVPMYTKKHGIAEMTFNRAVHLVRELTCV